MSWELEQAFSVCRRLAHPRDLRSKGRFPLVLTIHLLILIIINPPHDTLI